MNVRLALMLAGALAGCSSTAPAGNRPPTAPDRPVDHTAELLRHHPGVRVEGTSTGFRIYLRGALAEPLVILDGMPLMPDARGVLGAIEPADVSAIRVLTDAAELTFYGARGANGVVLITTKRPRPRGTGSTTP